MLESRGIVLSTRMERCDMEQAFCTSPSLCRTFDQKLQLACAVRVRNRSSLFGTVVVVTDLAVDKEYSKVQWVEIGDRCASASSH